MTTDVVLSCTNITTFRRTLPHYLPSSTVSNDVDLDLHSSGILRRLRRNSLTTFRDNLFTIVYSPK